MERLSVVLIVKNEEERIRRCLESVKWVDEVVVVDGMSTDRTAQICKEYGVKLIPHKFEGDFSIERNIGIDNSAGDWILQMDADEVMTEEFKEELRGILSKRQCEVSAYKFRRDTYLLGHMMRYGGWSPYVTMLFRRGKARYEGRVHHILKIDGKTGVMKAGLEHHPCDDIAHLLYKQNRYTSLQAKELFDIEGVLPMGRIRYNIIFKPLKIFRKNYFKKQGFREGIYGFIFSVIDAYSHFLLWVKYWQIVKKNEENLLCKKF